MSRGDDTSVTRGTVLQMLGRLREDLERQIGAVDEGVRELAGNVGKLGKGGGEEKDGEELQPFWPGDLTPDEWAGRRGELEEWVSSVLAVTHPTVAGRMPPCWVDHPAALEAVLAAWFAWCGAYRAKGRRPDDPYRYVRDVIPTLDARLEAEFQPKPGAQLANRQGPQCNHPNHLRPRSAS